MEIEDIKGTWIVEPIEKLIDGCELQCPECSEWVNHKDWLESEVYCEVCGEHTALKCPECDERFDHVWSKTFQCRVGELK